MSENLDEQKLKDEKFAACSTVLYRNEQTAMKVLCNCSQKDVLLIKFALNLRNKYSSIYDIWLLF